MLRKGNVVGVPANSKTFADYANRLYANGYFGGYPKNATDAVKIQNYTNGMIQANKYILQYIPDYLKKKNGSALDSPTITDIKKLAPIILISFAGLIFLLFKK
jgi:hypothetical protein